MTTQTLSKDIVLSKLKTAKNRLAKAESRLSSAQDNRNRAQKAVQKYEMVLSVFQEELENDSTDNQEVEFTKEDRLEYFITALHQLGGVASYKDIVKRMKENGFTEDISVQGVYSFAKTRCTPETGLEFVDNGIFKLNN